MSNEHTCDALFLNRHASGDNDLVLRALVKSKGVETLFSRNARRSKKKHSATPEVFDLGRIRYRAKASGMATLKEFLPLSSFPGLRMDLDKVGLASLLTETASKIIPEETPDSEQLFEALILGLKAIEQSKDLGQTLKAGYLATAGLLLETGYGAELSGNSPSIHNLYRLMDQIENVTNSELRARSCVALAIQEFSRQNRSANAR